MALNIGADGTTRGLRSINRKMIRSANKSNICKEHPRAFVNSRSQVWGENLPTLPSGSMRYWSDLNETLEPEGKGESS
jgi:hypothetical protein